MIKFESIEGVKKNPLDGGEMVEYVHAMLKEREHLKNISQTLNIDDPHWLKQLMMKATLIDFIAFHEMNLKELWIIIQQMLSINENGVN